MINGQHSFPHTIEFSRPLPLADLRERMVRAPPSGHTISFDFIQFSGEFGKIVFGAPPALRDLAPSPPGNSGSASIFTKQECHCCQLRFGWAIQKLKETYNVCYHWNLMLLYNIWYVISHSLTSKVSNRSNEENWDFLIPLLSNLLFSCFCLRKAINCVESRLYFMYSLA